MKKYLQNRIAELENEGKLKEIVMRQNEDVEEAILQQIHLDQISGAIDELIDALEHYEQQVQVTDAEEAAEKEYQDSLIDSDMQFKWNQYQEDRRNAYKIGWEAAPLSILEISEEEIDEMVEEKHPFINKNPGTWEYKSIDGMRQDYRQGIIDTLNKLQEK